MTERLWNPASRAFDGAGLRGEIVRRGRTLAEFAADCQLSTATLLHAVGGRPMRDRTVIAVLRTLARREMLSGA